MIKRSGFTLAEVLVTLVIIGIIAAMTIPTLLNNTNSQEYRSAIKKAIAMTNQAITMQYALDGTNISDFSTSANMRDSVFIKRLNVIKTASSTTFTGVAGNVDAIFYTADGMKFGVTGGAACDAAGDTVCATMYIDVNGDKKPNTLTSDATKPLDVYEARIYAQRVVPYGAATQAVMYN